MRLFLAIVCVAASLFIFEPLSKTEHPTIYVFTATWCGVCQRDKPRLQEFEAQGHVVVWIDFDKHPDLVKRHNVTAVPDYLVYEGAQLRVRTHNLDEAMQAAR